VALAKLEKALAPGDSCQWLFKMPNLPVSLTDEATIQAAMKADYDAERRKTIAYWRELIADGVRLMYNLPFYV
jgi:hypothetical protein